MKKSLILITALLILSACSNLPPEPSEKAPIGLATSSLDDSVITVYPGEFSNFLSVDIVDGKIEFVINADFVYERAYLLDINSRLWTELNLDGEKALPGREFPFLRRASGSFSQSSDTAVGGLDKYYVA